MAKTKFALLVLFAMQLYAGQLCVAQNSFYQVSTFKTALGNDTLTIAPLPFKTILQSIGDHPYDWNEGAMIPAKGYQQYLNGGVNLKWKNFELQLAPELVMAQNLVYEGFSERQELVHWKDYYRFYNFIEEPERMGNGQYTKFLGGQSFFKYHYKNTALQFSTANKWWGPAFRNALILSNNAAGFPHISVSNEKPVATNLGKFNYEFIWGSLMNANYPPPGSYLKYNGEAIYYPKENWTRAFQAMHVNYIPKWFPNLTLGLEQSFMQYDRNLNGLGNYIPIKNIFYRLPDDNPVQPIILTAFYFNYEFPQVNAKIYGEFGWNLNRTTFRNWLLQPDKGMANVLGFSKIISTNHNYNWEFKAEMANLQLLTVAEQFTNTAPTSWYLGTYVRQGYTNDGKIMGAGVGPGGTSQTIELNWRKGKNRIGLSGERRLHNDDFLVYSYTNSGDFRRFYVDFATTLKIDWTFNKLELGPRISYIQSNNYNWNLFQPQEVYFIPGMDKQQFIGKLNLTYHF
jgi:hypothetical protein